MLPLALALLLAQAPDARPVAVLPSARRPGAEKVARDVAERVRVLLGQEGLAPMPDAAALSALKKGGFQDPRNCDGASKCLKNLALLLGPRAVVVGVDVLKVGKKLVLHVEAVAADQEAALAVADDSVNADKWVEQSAAPLAVLVRDVKAKLLALQAPPTPPPEPPPADAPVASRVQPDPNASPNPALTAPAPEKKRSYALPVALLSAGAASGAAAVVLGVLGSQDVAVFNASTTTNGAGERVSTLNQAQLDALAASGNGKLTGALVAGIASGVLLALGGVSFAF